MGTPFMSGEYICNDFGVVGVLAFPVHLAAPGVFRMHPPYSGPGGGQLSIAVGEGGGLENSPVNPFTLVPWVPREVVDGEASAFLRIFLAIRFL